MTTHRERNAEVVSSSASSGVVRVTVRLSGKLIPPLSPASLFDPDSDFDSATIELHRLIALETDLATFESFGIRARLPNVGEILIFQSWWTPDQLELARDADRTWTERRFEAGPALLVHAEDDQSVLARATEQTLSDDAKLLPRGWDHEHCALCWAKIAEAPGQASAYFSDDDWLCIECYRSYVIGGLGQRVGDTLPSRPTTA